MTWSVVGALVLVQLLFASLAITGKFVLPHVPAFALVMFRLSGGALVFALASRRQRVAVAWPDRWRLMGLGMLGLAANQTVFLYGLHLTTAINATILVATIPVLTSIICVVNGSERLTALKAAGVALAATGTVWLIGPDRVAFDHRTALGNFWIELGMVAYALYLVYSRGMVHRYGSLTAVAWIFAGGLLAVLPLGAVALARLDWAAVPPAAWWWSVWIVLGPTVGTYFLNLWSLRRTTANVVAGFIYLQPVFTAIVAPLVLAGERVTPRALVAGVGIFIGLACILRAEQLAREASAAVA